MTGPVCPHCGDLARGCACPPEPYDGDLSANAIFPCWLSDIDRANFAEHERDQLLRAAVAIRDARQRADALAFSGTVAMIEAYEAEDAAIVALLALLPEPSPGAGRVES